MRRVAAVLALALALLASSSCRRGEAPAKVQRAYVFYFYESTAANKCILVDGDERAIEFDRATSDDAAVTSLLSLKWNVLYPNSKGAIALIGTYFPESGEFSLRHWFLTTPFPVYAGETTLDPGPLQWRDELDRNDFDPVLDFDPRTYNAEAAERASDSPRGATKP